MPICEELEEVFGEDFECDTACCLLLKEISHATP